MVAEAMHVLCEVRVASIMVEYKQVVGLRLHVKASPLEGAEVLAANATGVKNKVQPHLGSRLRYPFHLATR